MIFLDMKELETDRLILRKIKKSDAADMYEYAKNPKVSEYLTWSAHESCIFTKGYIKFLIKKYKTGEYFDWAVEHKETGKFIGTCGFSTYDEENKKAEIGYVLNPDFHKMGLATEAVRKIIEYALTDLNLHRIEARVIEGNAASEKVVAKCGLTYEGTGIDEMFIKGKYRTIRHYALINNK